MNSISLQVPEDVRETAIEQVVGSGETADEGEAQVVESEGNAGWATEGPQEETARRPGIDQVLRDVAENLGDQHADVIKGLQRDFTHHGEVESLKRQLRDAIGEVDSLREEIYENPEDVPDPLSEVPDEQLQLLELALERGGYVKKDDLDEQARNSLIDESNGYGVEVFGDSFGTIDEKNGEFVLNEEAKEQMAPVYNRIKNQDALTFEDLYKIANFDSLIEAAFTQGAEESVQKLRSQNNERVNQVIRGNVPRRNAGGVTANNIYNPDDLKGKSISQKLNSVMDNARRALETS